MCKALSLLENLFVFRLIARHVTRFTNKTAVTRKVKKKNKKKTTKHEGLAHLLKTVHSVDLTFASLHRILAHQFDVSLPTAF